MRVLLFEIWKHGGTAEYASNLSRALAESAGGGSSVSLVGPKGLDGGVCRTLPELTGGKGRSRPIRAARYGLQWAKQQFAII
ncbi:MAG TPA: hypothetical protein VFD22_14645, partial [Gemmatimonadaceae bacterium]|nr:hypothetical protein [Gemmatimonadaceae bacterium]